MNIKRKSGTAFIAATLGLSMLFAYSPQSYAQNNSDQAGSTEVKAASQASISSVQMASVSSRASQIIANGKKFLGVRYQLGAPAGVTSVFDCSSFTQYVYKRSGIQLPRSSQQQARVGRFVSRSQLQPGDLVFFYSPIHHVAIYMGGGKLLHTYGKPGVTISNLNSSFWSSHYNTARRVL